MNETLNGAILVVVVVAFCLMLGSGGVTSSVVSDNQGGSAGHPLLSD